jgi:Protein of unknown function (DUF2721)
MQIVDQTPLALRIVTSAVTPVVMVSATAILISGVNGRYIAVSDRVRALTREYREKPDAERCAVIEDQVKIFVRRIRLLSWATRLLFLGAGFFITVALLISVSNWNQNLAVITLPIFLIGLTLVASAIVLVFLELKDSNRTLLMEAAVVLAGRGQPQEDSSPSR